MLMNMTMENITAMENTQMAALLNQHLTFELGVRRILIVFRYVGIIISINSSYVTQYNILVGRLVPSRRFRINSLYVTVVHHTITEHKNNHVIINFTVIVS